MRAGDCAGDCRVTVGRAGGGANIAEEHVLPGSLTRTRNRTRTPKPKPKPEPKPNPNPNPNPDPDPDPKPNQVLEPPEHDMHLWQEKGPTVHAGKPEP